MVEPDAIADLPLLGARPGQIDMDLEFPLEFRDGNLNLQLVITNRTAEPLVIPPLNKDRISTGGCGNPYIGYRFVWHLQAYPFLGSGVRVVAPGETARILCQVRATETPESALLMIRTSSEWFEFRIGDRYGSISIEAGRIIVHGSNLPNRWDDVPKNAVQFRRSVLWRPADEE
jgi:hypothetical protein